MNFQEYVLLKLTTKLNLIMSQGKSTNGVVSQKVIDKLCNHVHQHGWYEIVWDINKSLPIGIHKMAFEEMEDLGGGKYLNISPHDKSGNRVLFSTQAIHFSLQEFRDKRLSKILK